MATALAQSTNADSLPPQSNFAKFDTPDRLVWHQFQGVWWPSIFYNSLEQFNAVVLEELDRKGDTSTKVKLGLYVMSKLLREKQGGPTLSRGIVRYLGRPIFEFQEVNEGEYGSFFDFIPMHMFPVTNDPTKFGQDKYHLYMDFHRGLDQTMSILSASGGVSFNEDGQSFEEKAQKSWDAQNWGNVAPPEQQQQQQQRQQSQQHGQQPQQQPPEPPSPNTNSVAAVSLADESMVSGNTSTTGTHQSYTETPVRQTEATPAKGTPSLDASPIQNRNAPWSEVWSKLAFSDWICKATKYGKTYSHPNLPHEFTLEQVQDYAKEHYGWLGERRTTRHSNRKGASPFKRKSFGVLWKKYLEGAGWKMVKAPAPIDWFYVRPGRSVDNGVEGEDYFISVDAVIDHCVNRAEYQSSSSSESEVSPDARKQASALHHSMETDDDDESTKLPAETDDDGSTVFLTPREQATKPQDPAKPQLSSEESASESEIEEDRYNFNVLWSRLKNDEGWEWSNAKNHIDTSWYIPPLNLQALKEDKSVWNGWTRGIDYFVENEEVVEYIKMKEGVGISEDEYHAKIVASASQGRGRRRTQPKTTKPPTKKKAASQKAKKAIGPKKSKAQSALPPLLTLPTEQAEVSPKSAAAAPASKPAKNMPKTKEADKKKKKRTKGAGTSSRKKPRKTVEAADINVRFHGDFNPAPWAVHRLPAQLHNILIGAGFTWTAHCYYLPGESPQKCTTKFDSAYQAIQYCATKGNVHFSGSPQTCAIMERLIAYANVPPKQSLWPSIRAITTKETIAFLNVLGYKASKNGSWEVPDAMVPYLEKKEFMSLDDLILALRRSDTLIPKTSHRRRGPKDDVLSKEHMLALRLRIAAGLGEVEEEEESSESSEEESVVPTTSKRINQEPSKATQSQEREREGSSETSDASSGETDSDASSGKTSECSASPESTSGSYDESTAIQNEVVNGINTLRASQVKPHVGWQLLQRVGCRYSNSSGYSLPNSSERFANQNDLVHYILNKSVLVLDFQTNPLPKAEVQKLHRYLKFHHVSLKCGETIGKALINMKDSDKIKALLEKIGFKFAKGLYTHTNVDGEFDLPQVTNAIRVQREDLMRIGQNGKRVREKKSLSMEDDYTLRIWAAESPIPLQLFDEDACCLEGMENDEEMDENKEDTNELSDEIFRPSEYSNDGDKVLEIEEASASNSGFICQSNRNQDSTEGLSDEVLKEESGGRALGLLTQDSASNSSEHCESHHGEGVPLATQPHEDESDNENGFSTTSSSLFEKAISPHERSGSSHPQTADKDAAMEDAEQDGIDEGRSIEYNMLMGEARMEDFETGGIDEHPDEGSREFASLGRPNHPLMTQVEED